jgi:branched-chain amino acid transport system permease protein
MSVGMNLVYGTTKLSSFSHGEQVSLGGLMAYVGTQLLHWPLVAAAIFAVAVGALDRLDSERTRMGSVAP